MVEILNLQNTFKDLNNGKDRGLERKITVFLEMVCKELKHILGLEVPSSCLVLFPCAF